MNRTGKIRQIFCLLLAVFTAGFAKSSVAKTSAWQEFSSRHFIVYSDRKAAEAKALLADFERFREAALVLTGLPAVDEGARTQIFLFNRQRDYLELQTDPSIAGYFRDTWQGPRMVVGAEAKLSDSSLVLFHEYVHLLMRAHSQLRYPLWYEEGFADLLAASVIHSRHAELGLVHPWRRNDLDKDGLLPVRSLLLPDENGDDRYWSHYYASAWLLMHFLQLGPLSGGPDYRAGMTSYLLAVHQGADLEDAFKQHFGVAPAQMDVQLKAYRDKKIWSGYRLELKPYAGQLRERRLTANEAAYLLGDLAYRSGQQAAALELLKRVDAKETTVARPFSLRAVIEHHLGRGDLAHHILVLALQQDSVDPYVLTNAAHVYWDKAQLQPAGSPDHAALLEKVADYAGRARAADAGNREAGHFLVQVARAQGRSEQAEAILSDLYRMHPTDVRLNLELGSLLSGGKQPQRAVPFLERVIAWDHAGARRLKAQQLLRDLGNTSTGKTRAAHLGDLDEEHLTPLQIMPR